jgi:hypothetical protein
MNFTVYGVHEVAHLHSVLLHALRSVCRKAEEKGNIVLRKEWRGGGNGGRERTAREASGRPQREKGCTARNRYSCSLSSHAATAAGDFGTSKSATTMLSASSPASTLRLAISLVSSLAIPLHGQHDGQHSLAMTRATPADHRTNSRLVRCSTSKSCAFESELLLLCILPVYSTATIRPESVVAFACVKKRINSCNADNRDALSFNATTFSFIYYFIILLILFYYYFFIDYIYRSNPKGKPNEICRASLEVK